MGKGTIRQLQYHTRTDPDTGACVTRLTPADVTCHRNYFYQKCFTRDGSRLLFAGEFGPAPSPHWNYQLLDLASGQARQLTEGQGENTFGGFLSPDDRHLFFVRGERQLLRLALDDLHEEVVYTVPEGWVGYGTWVANSACTRMVGIEIAADDWFPLSDWQKFHAMFHAQAALPADPHRPGAAGPARGHPGTAGLARPPAVPARRRPHRGLLPRRPARPDRRAHVVHRRGRHATAAAARCTQPAKAARTSSGCPTARP
jgi:hypothetical protein